MVFMSLSLFLLRSRHCILSYSKVLFKMTPGVGGIKDKGCGADPPTNTEKIELQLNFQTKKIWNLVKSIGFSLKNGKSFQHVGNKSGGAGTSYDTQRLKSSLFNSVLFVPILCTVFTNSRNILILKLKMWKLKEDVDKDLVDPKIRIIKASSMAIFVWCCRRKKWTLDPLPFDFGGMLVKGQLELLEISHPVPHIYAWWVTKASIPWLARGGRAQSRNGYTWNHTTCKSQWLSKREKCSPPGKSWCVFALIRFQKSLVRENELNCLPCHIFSLEIHTGWPVTAIVQNR